MLQVFRMGVPSSRPELGTLSASTLQTQSKCTRFKKFLYWIFFYKFALNSDFNSPPFQGMFLNFSLQEFALTLQCPNMTEKLLTGTLNHKPLLTNQLQSLPTFGM